MPNAHNAMSRTSAPADTAGKRPHVVVGELIGDLLAGPADAEQRDGLTSALLGNYIVVGIQLAEGRATVELTAALDETGRTDQILALAQIVCTLTAKTEITAVSSTRGGQPVGVPRADGSLSEAAATAADYASLWRGDSSTVLRNGAGDSCPVL
jgi:Sporulation and spore germination